MSNYFFSYLVEREIVAADAILSAFVEQIKQTPSLLETVVSLEKFSADQLLTVLAVQMDKKCSLDRAFAEVDFCSASEIEEILKIHQSRVRSLGSILIERGLISQKDYLKYLHEFVASSEKGVALEGSSELTQEIANNSLEDEAESEGPAVNQAALDSLKELVGDGAVDTSVLDELSDESSSADEVESEGSAVNQAALDSLKELVGDGAVDASVLDDLDSKSNEQSAQARKEYTGELSADSIFIDHLLDKFSEKELKKLDKLNVLIGESIASGDYPENLVKHFIKDLHTLMGAFSIVEIDLATDLLERVESRLNNLNETFIKTTEVDFAWKDNVPAVIQLLADIRMSIADTRSLANLVESKQWMQNYYAVMDKF